MKLDGLRMIDSSPESEAYALKSQNLDEIYVVPTFTGLGAHTGIKGAWFCLWAYPGNN